MDLRWTDSCRRHRSDPCSGAVQSDEGGYSLIELLTVIGILGVVFSAAFYVYFNGLNRTADAQDRKDALSAERVAIERITRDLREGETAIVRSSYSGPQVASGNVVDVTQPHERVIYDCTSGTCQRYALEKGTGSVTEGPVELIAGLDVSTDVFARGSSQEGSDDDYVRIRLGLLPERRARAIVLERSASIRNRCPAPASPLLPACP